ncbi:MAG: redoxin domain-containing protein [Anaerolineae bacterium]|nr:redoxin domain-containing protein [Anaerolineae bacterium]MCA9890422.1 redoxin domain-containing protein [Anaerolineae bacterium]
MKHIVLSLLTLPFLLFLAACTGNEAETSQTIEVGAKAPDFTLANAAGGDVSLSEYAGRPVLLYFHMAVG